MSAKYSTSPSLHLAIGKSRAQRVLHWLACLLAAFALYRISQRGYPLLALSLLPAIALCCWRTARQRLAGARINWHRGAWTVAQGSHPVPVTIRRGSTCLPWLIYLSWVESANARRGSVFLFPDSAPTEQLRRLRVRLTLER